LAEATVGPEFAKCVVETGLEKPALDACNSGDGNTATYAVFGYRVGTVGASDGGEDRPLTDVTGSFRIGDVVAGYVQRGTLGKERIFRDVQTEKSHDCGRSLSGLTQKRGNGCAFVTRVRDGIGMRWHP